MLFNSSRLGEFLKSCDAASRIDSRQGPRCLALPASVARSNSDDSVLRYSNRDHHHGDIFDVSY